MEPEKPLSEVEHIKIKSRYLQTPETVNRRIAEGWHLVGMVNDQRFLATAARAAREAVRTGA